MKVSDLAGLVRNGLLGGRDFHCEMSAGYTQSRSNSQNNSSNPGIKLLDRLMKKEADLCELYQLSEKATRPVFQSIAKQQQLPRKLFSFSVFVQDTKLEGYHPRTVGLFSDLEACQRMEHHAHSQGLPTRKCVIWGQEWAALGLVPGEDDSSKNQK